MAIFIAVILFLGIVIYSFSVSSSTLEDTNFKSIYVENDTQYKDKNKLT